MLIMAAPNGATRTKADHPALPVTAQETLACALACKAAGADALHLHVRNANGTHSIDPGLYRESIAALEAEAPGWPVQVTTESAGLFGPQDQLACLEALRPKWTTVSLREAARDAGIARAIYALAKDAGTEIQHIVFDAGDAAILADWQDKGVLSDEESVILVLGRYTANMNSDPANLAPLLASLPPVAKWMLCAFGPNEHACLREAARLGGDLRVGFENSTVQADGQPWPDMPASIAALRARLAALGAETPPP